MSSVDTKELPIIFSGPMVRAILDGRKTQTRRICQGQRELSNIHDFHLDRCPYGKPGDRLWVRETWVDVHPLQVAEGRYSQEGRAGIPGPPPVSYRTIYRADGEYPRIHFRHPDGTNVSTWPYRSVCTGDDCSRSHDHPEEGFNGWTPSIHMPRSFSRITLEVDNVRVERLQDISEADAKAEGVDPAECCAAYFHGFAKLWDKINAKRAPWDSNPWVWVIEFHRSQP